MRKFVSIFLVIIFLVSTTGMTLNVHYCGGKIYKTVFGYFNGRLLDCGMEKAAPGNCSNSAGTIDQNCCSNHIQKIHIEDNFYSSNLNISIDSVFAILAYVIVIHDNLTEVGVRDFFHQYEPPVLKSDIRVLFQTFLI